MRKRMILGVICAVMSMSLWAQAIRDGEMAIVYYMPQTQLEIEVEYEAVILHRGIYAEYAKQYLGTTEVVNDDDIWYHITAIRPRIRTVADYSRMYKVSNEPLLTLTRKGTLLGYNIEQSAVSSQKPDSPRPTQPQAQPADNEVRVLPLLEEHIVGKTLEQQAHGAAKLIYRIRENRLYLIGGEVDKTPSDGKAMELALNKMDQLEQELVELFIGRIEVVKHKKTITYTPVKSEEVDIAYFSEQSGFTTAGNGDPIRLSLTARRQTKGYANTESKKAPVPSQIYYNLPGSAMYKISYLNEISTEGDIQVAQFGVSVPLAQNLFNSKQGQPHIRFNTQTGNIEQIER
ncbi:MAG: DUF4831 family protein [Paludibacteraceae bacterium]|nr:DUF4831 family protein [Paludibacteraceae bacterium]